MNQIIEKVSEFIKKNGTNLQIAILNHLTSATNKELVVNTLKTYQNTDGGWANGLEWKLNIRVK